MTHATRIRFCALAAFALVACHDDPVATMRGTEVALLPSFSMNGAGGFAPITRLDVVVVDVAGDTVHRAPPIDVDPLARQFEAVVRFDLAERTELYVIVELLSDPDGTSMVEFTVQIGPLVVEPGRVNDASAAAHLVVRGPLANASVVDVALAGEPFLALGSDAVVHAAIEGGGPDRRVLWRTSDTTVVRIAPIGSDSARVSAVGHGSAVIWAEAGMVGDSMTVVVGDALPEQGEVLTWLGGTAGAPDDWFTPANWQPARVPSPLDSVFVPTGAVYPRLSRDAVVARVQGAFAHGAPYLDLGDATLTVTGDVFASIEATAGMLVLEGDAVRAYGIFPTTLVRGGLNADAGVPGPYLMVSGDLTIDGGAANPAFNLGDSAYVEVAGNLTLTDAHLAMGRYDGGEAFLSVLGDVTLDGGDGTGAITGGDLYLEGSFTVTGASCSAFAASPDHVTMFFPQQGARVHLECAGPEGNRFGYVEFAGGYQSGIDQTITLETDLYAHEIFPYYDIRLLGEGATRALRAASGWLHRSSLDNVVVEIENSDPSLYPLYAQEGDTVRFVNIADATRPQISVTHPGTFDDDVVYLSGILYDSLSAAPYLRIVDSDGSAPLLWAAAGHNYGDGPERTETGGGAFVIWEGMPWQLRIESGNNQSGQQGQPLAQPLRVQARGFWSDCRFCGGHTIQWSVDAGGGSIEPSTSVTDATGRARADWTMGPAATTQRAIARLPELAPFGTDTVVFSATSQP